MKKLTFFACVAGLLFIGYAMVHAGAQNNWGTSTGRSWLTPDDTAVVPGQLLVITSTSPYAVINVSSGVAVGIGSFTLAQLNALAPDRAGEIAFCSNCANAIAVSSGTGTGAWTLAASTSTHIL